MAFLSPASLPREQMRLASRFADLIDAVGIPGPDGLLVVFADAGTGNLVDERPAFWQPPSNDLVGQEVPQVTGLDGGAFFGDDDGQGSFLPPLVGNPDYRSLDHVWVRDQAVLQFDRRNPFPARLDHVFGAIGQRDEASFVDATHVAGAKPAGVEFRLVVPPIVGTGDPGTANFHLTDGLAVVGQHLPVVVDDPGFHTAYRLTLARTERPVLVLRGARRRPGHGGHRRGFGHAPQLADLNAVFVLEGTHQRHQHGRAAARHYPQRRHVVAGIVVQVVHDVVPDGGHRPGHGGPQLLDHVDQRLGVQMAIGQHQVGARHQRRVWQAPGVGVEHRHDRQHAIAGTDANAVAATGGHGVQIARTVAVDDAFRVASGATGVTHCGRAVLVDVRPVELG